MSLFGRLFGSRRQRRDAEQARQIIEAAFKKSREPKKCAEAAALGADMRTRLFSVVDRLEAEMGQLVIAYAQQEGVLMTHPRLAEELRKRPDGEMLDLAIPLCFVTPAATTRLNADWPERVRKYRGHQNTDETISEKASALTAYVVHNLGVGTAVSKDVLKDEREINDEQEVSVKVEEACLWYRLIDEAAYLAIGAAISVYGFLRGQTGGAACPARRRSGNDLPYPVGTIGRIRPVPGMGVQRSRQDGRDTILERRETYWRADWV